MRDRDFAFWKERKANLKENADERKRNMVKNPSEYAHMDADKRLEEDQKEQKRIREHEAAKPNMNKNFKKKFRTKEEISEHFRADCEAFEFTCPDCGTVNKR